MSQQQAQSVVVYADYICPFCYLGYESFDSYRAGREQPIETEWRPFDLRSQQRNPDGTIDWDVDTGKDEAYYDQARENVKRLAEKYDVEMAQPLATEIDSYDPQRVAYNVAEAYPDQFEPFHRAIFDALWEEGKDIGDRAVLEALASDVGLPEGVVGDVLGDPATAEALDDAFRTAQQERITGVPTFEYGEHRARGAVPPAQLRRLIEGN